MRRISLSCLCILGLLFGGAQVYAQGTTRIDTIYTPQGYPEPGPFTASIYIPDPSLAKGVGVVLAHWRLGKRSMLKVWCDTLASRGYVAMTIDYTDLGGGAGRYPEPVREVKVAVEFLKRNWERFGITTKKIVGFGQGGGSTIWGEAIVTENDDAFFGTDPTIDDHLAAAILLYGSYDNYNYLSPDILTLITSYFSADPSLRATKGNCIANVDKITTPLLLLHGTTDGNVYVEQSRVLHDSLTSRGRRCDLIEYTAGHTFDISIIGSDTIFSPTGLKAKDDALSFLENVVAVSDVPSEKFETPTGFELAQNYPNPFNPQTLIRYSLPRSSHVRLEVIDLLGRQVALLVNGMQDRGSHDATFDASNLASGIYIYRLYAEDFVAARKMLLLR